VCRMAHISISGSEAKGFASSWTQIGGLDVQAPLLGGAARTRSWCYFRNVDLVGVFVNHG
jgi:hypothetical protein